MDGFYNMIRKLICVLLLAMLALFPLADARAAGAISYGNQNDGIADLQEKLKTLGYFSGECTGFFGEDTQIAIENFQKANGLSVTGAADPDMIRVLDSEKAVTKQQYIEEAVRGEEFEEAIGPKSSGKTVRKLQNLLIALGYDAGKPEGAYNAQTEYAVRLFQWANLLPVTGVADPETMRVMTSGGAVACGERVTGCVLRYGDQGNDVKSIQNCLRDAGYFSGECSGKFGRKTQEAVISFQKANGLEATGECGVSLILMLMSGNGVTRAEADRVEATRQVMLGEEADCVSTVKSQLSTLGFYRGETGTVFTQELAQAVSYFQDANEMPSTGIADAETREKLNSGDCVNMDAYAARMASCEAKPGDEGYSVILLQMKLRELGFLNDAITGVYEKSTQDAVALFQKGNLLPETGVADAETRKRMNSPDALDAARAQEDFIARAEENERKLLGDHLCEIALECVSKPYEAGKAGPDEFGNAGLACFCFQTVGVELAPTTDMQLENAREAETWSGNAADLSIGRQVFVKADGEVFTSIYVGDGIFVYASNAQKMVIAVENIQEIEGYEFVGSVRWF